MASAIYDKAREWFLDGQISWSADTIKMILIDTGAYTFSAAHDFLDDVPSGARIGSAATLASKTITSGVADAADPTFSAVTGSDIEAVIVYKDVGGLDSTRKLICYVDGIAVNPNGSDITVAIDNGADKLFKL